MLRRKVYFATLFLVFSILACSVPAGVTPTNTPEPPPANLAGIWTDDVFHTYSIVVEQNGRFVVNAVILQDGSQTVSGNGDFTYSMEDGYPLSWIFRDPNASGAQVHFWVETLAGFAGDQLNGWYDTPAIGRTAVTFHRIASLPVFPTPTVQLQNGTISGYVNYPSDFIPPQRVFAFKAGDFNTYIYTETALNQSEYSISVPPGDYYILSYVIDGSMAGGYTQAVLCGNKYGCNDHSFVPVTVYPGQMTSGINPSDWYAPVGTFPPMP